jgi:Membrane carboxypeptidase (penicillin-binding protein)
MSLKKKLNVGSVFKKRSRAKIAELDPSSKKARVLRMKKERLSHLPYKRSDRMKHYLTHPTELAQYWFSLEGRAMLRKCLFWFVIAVLIIIVFFMWIPSSVDAKNMDDTIKQRIQTTTNRYIDRNGELLWEDSGSGNVLKFVESEQISEHLKNATVAIEDHSFYDHGGVSISGIMRAVVNNFGGGATQGGSTLTQQLMKQVFFVDEANERGILGIPRKIKEMFMSIEAERSYNKDQIITYYLNVAPYGGRRNGVQSAAETYFGKNATDLTLAESALIAGIPQYPSAYNPYNTEYNSSLIERYNNVLNAIAEYMPDKYNREEIEAAREEFTIDTIADKIKPIDELSSGAKAPHFIDMVKQNLEKELGAAVMGQGGVTIKTTLDIRVQNIIDAEIDRLFDSSTPTSLGFDNAAATMVDSQTGQVLGMRGSRDYNFPDYGAVNAATSFIQPGSSIKPQVYAALIDTQRDGKSYGGGTVISDNDNGRSVQQIYGAPIQNANGSTNGSTTLRNGLSQSLNIPAVMAMYYNGGTEPTLETIRAMGDVSYCTDGVDAQVGLSSAIGGCGAKQVEHTNAFATLARGGTYKPVTSVLEVTDFHNNIMYENDPEKDVRQVIDPQSAYIVNDVLSDANSRSATFGYCSAGFCIPNVKTATKTGTSDLGGKQKDLWMASYSPKASLTMWWGNHVPATLRSGDGMSLGPYIQRIMSQSHLDVFEQDGAWTKNQWFDKPDGIQSLNISGRADLFPSWYIKSNSQVATESIVFDRISKKMATECTPEGARETLEVITTYNAITNTIEFQVPEGYDPHNYDDIHSCDAIAKPALIAISAAPEGSAYRVTAGISRGNNPAPNIVSVTFTVNGQTYQGSALSDTDWAITIARRSTVETVVVTITDEAGYVATGQQTVSFP